MWHKIIQDIDKNIECPSVGYKSTVCNNSNKVLSQQEIYQSLLCLEI